MSSPTLPPPEPHESVPFMAGRGGVPISRTTVEMVGDSHISDVEVLDRLVYETFVRCSPERGHALKADPPPLVREPDTPSQKPQARGPSYVYEVPGGWVERILERTRQAWRLSCRGETPVDQVRTKKELTSTLRGMERSKTLTPQYHSNHTRSRTSTDLLLH